VITPKDGAGFGTESKDSKEVTICTDISGGTVTLSSTAPTTADVVTATVKDAAKNDITDHCAYQWYVDSVSDANLIKGATAATINLTTEHTIGAATATLLTGHKLICVATGYAIANYDGSVTSAATSAVTSSLSEITVESDTSAVGEMTYPIGTTLTAKLATGETGTFQWYENGIAVPGATGATYMLKTSSAKVYCQATGTGYYTGNKESEVYTAGTATAAAVKIAKDADGSALTNPVTGDTLYAVTTPKTAAKYVTYQWYKGTTAISGATSATYAPTEAGSYKVAATLTTDGQAIWKNGTTAFASDAVTVTEKIDSLALTIKDTAATPAATTNTYVGYTITATPTPAAAATGATYHWYRDNTANDPIDQATDASYTIKPADIGHKLVCKITGSGTYANATAVAKTSKNAVYDLCRLTVSNYIPTVGKSTDAATFTGYGSQSGSTMIADEILKECSTYTWAVNGTTVAKNETYTPVAADYGKALSVTVSGDGVNASGAAFYVYEEGVENGSFLVDLVGTFTSYAVGDTIAVKTEPADASVTAKFQWYRSDADTVDNAYAALASGYAGSYKTTAISGATGTSYKLTSADAEKTVICVVTNGRGYAAADTPYAGTATVVSQ